LLCGVGNAGGKSGVRISRFNQGGFAKEWGCRGGWFWEKEGESGRYSVIGGIGIKEKVEYYRREYLEQSGLRKGEGVIKSLGGVSLA